MDGLVRVAYRFRDANDHNEVQQGPHVPPGSIPAIGDVLTFATQPVAWSEYRSWSVQDREWHNPTPSRFGDVTLMLIPKPLPL